MQYGKIEAATDQEFAQKGADAIAAQLRYVIKTKGQCVLGLCGGSTPKEVYKLLAHEPMIDWSQVNVFLLDERYVPPSDPQSNQALVRETILDVIDIPELNIVFPDTTLPLDECVSDYNERVDQLLGNDTADVVTIGMGDDGHIASLFPELTDEMLDRNKCAVHTQTDTFDVKDRISITLPKIVLAKLPIFLLKGEKKKTVWNQMIQDKENFLRWPAQAVLREGRAIAIIQ